MKKVFYEQSLGYHSFNLYAFSVLSRLSDELNNKLKSNKKFNMALKFVLKKKYERSLINNIYAFQYNPTGIEIAYTIIAFSDIIKDLYGKNPKSLSSYWLNKQLNLHFSIRDGYLNKNTIDGKILSARLYEATRIPNMPLQFGAN